MRGIVLFIISWSFTKPKKIQTLDLSKRRIGICFIIFIQTLKPHNWHLFHSEFALSFEQKSIATSSRGLVTMRFKKGDKVEVMNNREMPVSWHPAKILSSTGHTYTVEYDFHSSLMTNRVVERISTDSVRPCPPQVMGIDIFDAGDIVEVFHDYAWSVAAIMNTLPVQKVGRRKTEFKRAAMLGSRYLVRLLGCSLQLIVDISNIRMRKTWNDGTWILMEKNFRAAGYLTATKAPKYDDTSMWEPTEISLRAKKRMLPFDSSTENLHSGLVKKLRISKKKGLKHNVAAALIPEKVHAVAYPILGEQNMHASNSVIFNRFNQMEKAKHDKYIDLSGSRSIELSTDDDDTCSIGSCSVTSHGMKCSYTRPLIASYAGTDAICSDAESCCDSESDRDTSSLPPNKELEGYNPRRPFIAFSYLNVGRLSRRRDVHILFLR